MIKNMMQVAKSYILSSMRSDSEYKKSIFPKVTFFFSSVIIMEISNYRDFYKARDDLGGEREVSVYLSRIYRMIPALRPK